MLRSLWLLTSGKFASFLSLCACCVRVARAMAEGARGEDPGDVFMVTNCLLSLEIVIAHEWFDDTLDLSQWWPAYNRLRFAYRQRCRAACQALCGLG